MQREMQQEAAMKSKTDARTVAKTDDGKSVDRRGFLRSIGGATVASAAVAVGAPAPAAAAENDDDKKKARYRESDHVKAYYRTNRY
jgi:hypothetical protein